MNRAVGTPDLSGSDLSIPTRCRLKSAFRFMAREQVRKEQETTREPASRSRRLDNLCRCSYDSAMPVDAPVVMPDIEEDTQSRDDLEPGYLVVCWNDPVNFMEYVAHVFQKVFGWQKQKADFHMIEVHNNGKSVLLREGLEKAEFYVHQLQKYTLHATLERDK